MKKHKQSKTYKAGLPISLYMAFFILLSSPLLKAQKLQWAAVMGSNEQSSGKDIAMDKSGNVFSVGWYSAGQLIGAQPADFDPGPGQVLFSQSGNYLSKLNANGTFGYVKRFAGTASGGVTITQIALDSIGNIFLTGNIYLTADLDPGAATVMYTDSTNGNDLIVYKFSPTGNLLWYKIWPITTLNFYLGCDINELELDKNGNLILVGSLYGETDFDLGPDTASAWGDFNFPSGFLLKLDGNGNYLWDYTIDLLTNGTSSNAMVNCAINNQNEIYVAGGYWGSINFFSPDTFTFTANGFFDNYILKINETGNLLWAKSFGGGSYESVSDIHYSNDGHLYIAASYGSPTVVLANDTNSIVMLGDSINTISALIKMNENGNYEWIRYLKNSNLSASAVSPVAVKTDSIGQIYFMNVGLTGTTYTNYNIDSSKVITPGESCTIVNKYTADGTFIRSSAAIGDYRIFAKSMAMDKNASIAFTGDLVSDLYLANDPNPNPIDADPDTSRFSIFDRGSSSIFVIKWNQCSIGTTIIDTTVCSSFSLNGNNYTQSGTYNFYETTTNRCDSNATLNLTILLPSNAFQNIQLCAGDSIQVGNQTYMQSGIYQNVLTASNGCDSTVTTTLFIDTLQAQISNAGQTLSAVNSPSNATFQWLDCDDNFNAILNQTDSVFYVINDGNYALLVAQNGCVDTSICYNVTTVNLNEITNNLIAVYPNPTKEEFYVSVPVINNLVSLSIMDTKGQLIKELPVKHSKIMIDDLAPGIYFIQYQTKSNIQYCKIVKL
jgi:hypothetical protein